MPNLKTGWEIIATSGDTIDGRKIEKQWLVDMAETYSPSYYSAKIWPEHLRDWGSQGKVLALKTEPAKEEQLKGEIHLMAIIAPSEELVWMNKRGKWVHTSIEVLKNFANKGKFYLGGLAVTDTPASLGTSELKFTEQDEKFFFSGDQLDLSSASEEKESLFGKLFKPKTEQETDMKDEQFKQLLDAQTETNKALTALVNTFAKKEEPAAAKPTETPAAKTEGPTEKFVSQDEFKKLSEKIDAISTSFEELKKKPVGQTEPANAESEANKELL